MFLFSDMTELSEAIFNGYVCYVTYKNRFYLIDLVNVVNMIVDVWFNASVSNRWKCLSRFEL